MSPAAVQIGKSTQHIRELMNTANADIVFTLADPGPEIDNGALEKVLLKMTHDEGDLYFECPERLSIHLDGLETTFGVAHHRAFERDLDEILRSLEDTVSDPRAFGRQPSNESELHARVEAVLRSVFGSES